MNPAITVGEEANPYSGGNTKPAAAVASALPRNWQVAVDIAAGST
jgi:hypothetical protein